MVWWGRLQPFNPSAARTSLSRLAPTATCSAHAAAGAGGGNHGDVNSCGAIFQRATAAPHGVGAVEQVGTRADLAKPMYTVKNNRPGDVRCRTKELEQCFSRNAEGCASPI